MAKHHLEILDVFLPNIRIGMNKIRVSGNGDHGEICVAERIADLMRLFLGQRLLCRVKIFKRDVELDAIEIRCFDAANDFVHGVGIVAGKNAYADHE